MTSPNDSLDDSEEPRLSYEHISNDLTDTIKLETITSSCLHNKFFAIGTLSGRISIFDHQGNKVVRQDRRDQHSSQELCLHYPKSVNSINIDEKGEYLVSCSDYKLVVYGLCESEHNYVEMLDRPVNVVAIDPAFHRPGNGRRFVAAGDRVILYEKGFLARYKTTILQSNGQEVRTLSWHEQFIAWATDHAIQIFDIEQRAIITRIKRDTDIGINRDPCRFCWKDKKTLLIGWSNTVKVCVIKERSQEAINDTQLKELPRKYVEIVSMFETDFTIVGLSPFDNHLLVLSLHHPNRRQRSLSRDTQSSRDVSLTSNQSHNNSSSATHQSDLTQSGVDLIRPRVHILETSSSTYNELSIEILKAKGCVESASKNTGRQSKGFPYNLLSLHEDGIYFIFCPKDVISAKLWDSDDHIEWLKQRSMFKECYIFAKEYSNELSRHTLREIEEKYLEELLSKNTSESYGEAGQLCCSICDSDQKSWDDMIKKFCELGQLKHLLPHLPRKSNSFHLNQESFDFILNEFLGNDPVSFFKAIKEIPSQMYSLQSMTDQVIRNLANDPKNLVLNEALAELYTQMGRFEEAVNIYLDYNDKTRIFSLIRSNSLVSILRDRVDRLMQIDADQTSQLLVENIESILMKDVVDRLGKYKSERYLVSYLHRLIMKDPDSCIEYHDLMVKLYATHQQGSLLNFLKLSTNYRLEEALRICKDANLLKEVVFLHGRMGDLRVALKYIIEQGDIYEAIEFCKEHQDLELWQDLILYSMDRPEFIGELLKNIGTHINDPMELVDRIPNGCEIEGLMPALVKILQDYQLQISLEQSCRELMAKDCFSLLQKQIRCQTQGIAIKDEQLCHHCNQPLLNDSVIDNLIQNRITGLEQSTSGVNSRTPQSPGSGLNDLVVFGCHHVFHEECCADSPTLESDLSSKILTCRVCMLENEDETSAGY